VVRVTRTFRAEGYLVNKNRKGAYKVSVLYFYCIFIDKFYANYARTYCTWGSLFLLSACIGFNLRMVTSFPDLNNTFLILSLKET
jgi:hypothetical protein